MPNELFMMTLCWVLIFSLLWNHIFFNEESLQSIHDLCWNCWRSCICSEVMILKCLERRIKFTLWKINSKLMHITLDISPSYRIDVKKHVFQMWLSEVRCNCPKDVYLCMFTWIYHWMILWSPDVRTGVSSAVSLSAGSRLGMVMLV